MALVHYVFNYDHWEFRLESGADKGRDCAFEYVDDENSWQRHHIHFDKTECTKKLQKANRR